MVDNQHWIDRWEQNRIGFHESDVNPLLVKHFPHFNLKPGSSIFLPLCGKSVDMVWLAEQGYDVFGIELSQLAIESFFEEQDLSCQLFESDRFVLYKSNNINILQGDFYDLRAEDLPDYSLVYDRASLIAFESHHRPDYCAHLRAIMPPQAKMLLITLHYDQQKMKGPPFGVSDDEVRTAYQSGYDIDVLEQNEILDERPRWRSLGLDFLTETVFSLAPTVNRS